MKEKRESSESSDTSSETLGSEVMSPLLAIQQEPEAIKYDQQYNHYEPVYHEPYAYYQSPAFQTYSAHKEEMPPSTVYTPINDYSNGLIYSNETNPYQVQHPSGEAEANNAYAYQNQYNSEIYNWCANNTDSYNFYQ